MSRWAIPLAGLFVALIFVQIEAMPGDLIQTFLHPTPQPPLQPNDYFGYRIATVGDNVLIGAHTDDTAGPNAGAAYLYDGADGTLLHTFLNPVPEETGYGYSVAGIGNNVAIGNTGDAVRLYDGETGVLLHTLENPLDSDLDYSEFGICVAGLGNNVLVGDHAADVGEEDAGAVYLFDGQTGQLLQTFENPSPGSGTVFGYTVAGVGNNVLVGNHNDSTAGNRAGAAYLFDGTTGMLLHTFLNPTPGYQDWFGLSLAGLGSDILIGAYADDTIIGNAGAVYLFDSVDGNLVRTYYSPIPDNDIYFGYSLASIGDDILVGTPRHSRGDNDDPGAAYLIDGETGELLQTFMKPLAANDDWFGVSVAGVGNNVAVGAYLDDTAGDDAGAVYLFEGIPEPQTLALLAIALSPFLLTRKK